MAPALPRRLRRRGLPDSHGLRIAGAGSSSRRSAAFSGRTAAYLHGATSWSARETPVEVLGAGGRAVRPGGRAAGPAGRPAGDPTSARSDAAVHDRAADRARHRPVRAADDAVVALDVLLARVVVGKGELAEAAAAGTWPAGRCARTARRRAGGSAARSRRRSRGCGCCSPWPACPPSRSTRSGTRRRASSRGSTWPSPSSRIAIEYDGAWHGESGQLAKDRRRLNRLVAAGWTVLHVTAADMHDPEAWSPASGRCSAHPSSGK